MSEYELARLRRMQENARLLESTGIMSSIAKQVQSLASQDSKETGSPAKKKRAREDAAETVPASASRSLVLLPANDLRRHLTSKTMQL